MAKLSEQKFWEMLRSRAAESTADRVRDLWERLEQIRLEPAPDEDRGKDVHGYWFVLNAGGKKYSIVRIIYGYPKETKRGTKVTQGPGWVLFRPHGKRSPFPPDVAAQLEQRLVDSGFYDTKEVSGTIYQVRATDLDKPEVRKHVLETCKGLVSVLRKP